MGFAQELSEVFEGFGLHFVAELVPVPPEREAQQLGHVPLVEILRAVLP